MAETFTQADVDRVVENRLKRERDKQAAAVSELQSKIAEYEAADQGQETGNADELDSMKADLEKAQSETQSATAEANQFRKGIARLHWIAANAPPELPVAYRQLIRGEDEATLQRSLGYAIAEYQAEKNRRQ